MQATVMIDGCLLSPEHAVVSVFDRGFLYGDSVFESLRSYDGKLFALGEHLARLRASAERVHIGLPVSSDELEREVHETVRAHGARDSYVRVMFTRGTAPSLGLDPALAGPALRVVIASGFMPPPETLYEQGIAAISFRAERVSDPVGVAAAKVGNYLTAVLALGAARERGASEAFIVDGSGRIFEAATSNVFAVVSRFLVTPGDQEPILPGITRRHVLELARLAGLPVQFRSFTAEELRQADEVFVTSSLRELVPVVRIDGHEVGSRVPGGVTQRLLRDYRALVRR